MARALTTVLRAESLTVIVNVGDDDSVYGLHVAADIDTVVYTLAGVVGPHGWGRERDTFTVMTELDRFGVETSFRLGDADLALCLERTNRLAAGEPLSSVTTDLATRLGVSARVLPASDDSVPTMVQVGSGEWLPFQEYFVRRGHADEVLDLRYEGSDAAKAAPGVLEALREATLVVIAPSNPPLSIWPILAIPGIRDEVHRHGNVAAISPLFGGKPLKGPADRVMTGMGLPQGNAGVASAYDGLITDLVVDTEDADDVRSLQSPNLRVHAADTRIGDPSAGERFSKWLLAEVGP